MSILEKLPKPFFVLAPMDDVTDTVFRQIIAGTAAPDLFFTEFVNVDGLQSPGRAKLLPKLRFSDRERPIIAQIWGKIPDNYYKTAQDIVAMGYDGVDINMGCPDKAVVKNGCCSALIENRELAAEIIKAVKKGVDGKIPVSVKTRIGFNSIDLTWIEFLLQQDLDMLTIHARTKKEMSKVPAHWDLFTEIVALRDRITPATKLVGNGDVLSKQQGVDLAEQYGLDGIMIGRGIFHDPYLFADQTPWPSMTKEEKIALYKKQVQLFADTWQNNERRVATLNKFCKVYIQGFNGAKELREKLMNAKTTNELLDILNVVS
jgi:tRNA-dihydrouridine synthase